MSEQLNVVGKPVKRKDGFEKVTGRAKYCNDVQLQGMLHGKILRCPYAQADIVSIDTSAAKALPGVELIITHEDFPQIFYKDLHSVGAEVACVVATDEETAKEALRLIKVKYDVKPFVVDPVKAMDPNCPRVFPDRPNLNDFPEHYYFSDKNGKGLYTRREHADFTGFGDVERGFREADVIVEDEGYRYNLAHTPFMSTCGCVASFESGKLTVYLPSQWKHGNKTGPHLDLGVPLNKINVVAPYTGGSFGGRLDSGICGIMPRRTEKGHINGQPTYSLIAAAAAMTLGKPVGVFFSKEEDFCYHWCRGSYDSKVAMGFKKDGTLTTMHVEIWRNLTNGGTYATQKFDGASTGLMLYSHNCEHMRYIKKYVFTNGPASYGWQGFGNPPVFLLVESVMDKAAEVLNMDPVDLRRKNHVRQGDNVLDCCYPFSSKGHYLSSCGISEVLDAGVEKTDWRSRKQPADKTGTIRHGLGMALSGEQTGGMSLWTSAIVRIFLDGTALLVCGADEMGQGQHTTQSQIVAEVLGIPYESVSISNSDTDSTPYCDYMMCSSGTLKVGYAIYNAAQEAKRKLLEIAAPILGVTPEDLDTKNGFVYIKTDPERGITWSQAIGSQGYVSKAEEILGYGDHRTSAGPKPLEQGATFVSLDVDTETGQLMNIKVTHSQYVGRALNPKVVEGVFLGAHHGVEAMMGAECVLDNTTGRLLNDNWIDYPVATILDSEVDPVIVEIPPGDPTHPYGAIGIGMGSQNGLGAAFSNAIYNAIGVRLKEVPFTPEKILRALGKI